MRALVLRLVVAMVFMPVFVMAANAPPERTELPGRHVKVAAIAIGFGGDHDRNSVWHWSIWKRLDNSVDIACLPEEYWAPRRNRSPAPPSTP